MAEGDLTAQFAQLSRDLEKVSDDIKREVGALIPQAAESMAQAVEARYPVGKTGRLHNGVRIRTLVGNDHLLPVKKVIGPPLAFIWQDGTVQRHNYTRKNANRGRSPAHDPGMFQRKAVEARARMVQQAQAVVDRNRTI